MEQIFFLFFLLLFGYLLKFLEFPRTFSQSLNLFIIYISLPATVLLQIPKIDFDTTLLLPAIVPYLVLAFSIIIIKILFKHESRNTKAALYLLLPLGNTSFFGFPMIEALVGKDALKYGVVYDLFGSFAILTIYGAFVISYFGGDKIDIKSISKKILIFPPFVALLIAFLIGEMPKITLPFIELLSHTLVPLAMISVGFSLNLNLSHEKNVFYKALLIKLLILPCLIFSILNIFNFSGDVALVTLMESAMPPMITAGALAINAGFAPKLSAALVGYGILIALLTIPLFEYFFYLA